MTLTLLAVGSLLFLAGAIAGGVTVALVRHLSAVDESTATGGSAEALAALLAEADPAPSRTWLRPGRRVVHDLYGVGSVSDPDAVRRMLFGYDPPAGYADRWPVVFDAEPLTYRWVDPAEVDPITREDEDRLHELARRVVDAAPPLSRPAAVRPLCPHHGTDVVACVPPCCVFCSAVTREDRS